MSFILDALRKAERERNIGRPPRIQDVAQPPLPRRRRPQGPWVWTVATGVVALLVIAVLLALLLRREPASAPPAAAVKPRPALSGAQPTETGGLQPAPRPAAETAPAATSAPIEDGASLATLDDLLPPQPLPVAAAAAPPPAPLPAQPEPTIAALSPPPKAATPAGAARIESLRLAPPPEPGLPRLHEMPANYRSSFPPLEVAVHVYNPDPQRRFLLINGRRYSEGNRLAEGPTVLEITAEGIVFDYRGQRVLYELGR